MKTSYHYPLDNGIGEITMHWVTLTIDMPGLNTEQRRFDPRNALNTNLFVFNNHQKLHAIVVLPYNKQNVAFTKKPKICPRKKRVKSAWGIISRQNIKARHIACGGGFCFLSPNFAVEGLLSRISEERRKKKNCRISWGSHFNYTLKEINGKNVYSPFSNPMSCQVP